MAVTYAWRLDADKYAYICDENGTAGLTSTAPLASANLNAIALKAQEIYSEDLVAYRNAFNIMMGKIEKDFGKNYDLLSADIYFNVDSEDCSNLKGIGIRGVRYLGGANTRPSDGKWNWNANVNEGQPGYWSVYGVYMDDQDDSASPESIFVVRNGADAEGAETNVTYVTTELLKAEEIARISGDTELANSITKLSDKVDNAIEISGVDWASVLAAVEAISTFNERLNEMESIIGALNSQIIDLQNQIDELSGTNSPGVDPGTGGGGGIAEPEEYTNGQLKLLGYDPNYPNTLYYVGGLTYDGGTLTTTNVSANVSGNVIGNVSGNITGNVTGNVNGNVTASTISVGSVMNVDVDTGAFFNSGLITKSIAAEGTIATTGNLSGVNITASGNISADGTVSGATVSGTTVKTSGVTLSGDTITTKSVDASGTITAASGFYEE